MTVKKKLKKKKVVTLDRVFAKRQKEIKKFQFNNIVAEVFDDMVTRSIPIYFEVHRLICDLLTHHLTSGGRVYDLGCSTGSTILNIHKWAQKNNIEDILLIGVDNSQAMIKQCTAKWESEKVLGAIALCQDLDQIKLEKCDIVIMNYTLQFISPQKRLKLVRKIHKALRPGGIFILSEKLKSNNEVVDKELIKLYYDFKRRNGYSELEISQKREALEKVLIPWTSEKQLKLLKTAGLIKSEMIFRWYNFGTFIGIK